MTDRTFTVGQRVRWILPFRTSEGRYRSSATIEATVCTVVGDHVLIGWMETEAKPTGVYRAEHWGTAQKEDAAKQGCSFALWVATRDVLDSPPLIPTQDNPTGRSEHCNGCGKPLLLWNLYVDDGCPCNTPRGVNLKPQPCPFCGTNDCVKPGHRLRELFGVDPLVWYLRKAMAYVETVAAEPGHPTAREEAQSFLDQIRIVLGDPCPH